jgi:hypothetical protein
MHKQQQGHLDTPAPFLLREVLDQLDGAGMILVDYDEIKQALREMGLTLDTPVTASRGVHPATVADTLAGR